MWPLRRSAFRKPLIWPLSSSAPGAMWLTSGSTASRSNCIWKSCGSRTSTSAWGWYQPHADVDVLDPQLFHMQFDRLAVDPDVSHIAPGADELNGHIKGLRNADRLNGHIDTCSVGQRP